MESVKRKIVILMSIVLMFIAFAFAGCDEDKRILIENLRFNKSQIVMTQGTQQTLSVLYTVKNDLEVNYFISSNNTEAVQVVETVNGVQINAVGVGKATVSVTLDLGDVYKATKLTAVCEITVNPEAQVLSIPQNIRFDGEKVVWNKVSQSNGYLVKLNGVETSAIFANTYYRDFEKGVVNTIEVKSVGDNYNTTDSAYSEVFTFKQLSAPTISIIASTIYVDNIEEGQAYKLYQDNVLLKDNVTANMQVINSNLSVGRHSFKVVAKATNVGEYDSPYSQDAIVTKLSAPTNAVVMNKSLSFTKPAGVTQSTIKIVNNTTQSQKVITIDGNTFALSNINESGVDEYQPGAYNIYLKSVGNGVTTLDSEYSTSYASDKLSSPQNVTITDGVVSWTAVENASGYIINKTKYETQLLPDETNLLSYDFGKNNIEKGDYQISVIATGQGRFISSEPSVSLEITRLDCPQNIKIVAGVLTWDSMGEGVQYDLDIGLATPITTSNSHFDFSGAEFLAGNYVAYIRALGNGTNVLESEYSNGYQFGKLTAPDISTMSVKHESVNWDKVKNVLNYEVYINGSETPVVVTGEQIQLTGKNYPSGIYNIAVRSLSSADNLINSDKSEIWSCQKLSLPMQQSITINGEGLLTWSMPENSGVVFGYNLKIGSNQITILDTKADLDGILFGGSRVDISIQAIGDNATTLSSNWTESKSFMKLSNDMKAVVSNGVLTWSKVEGAKEYLIYLSNLDENTLETIQVSSTAVASYELKEYLYKPGNYEIKMRAVGGEGSDCLISSYTPILSVVKLDTVKNLKIDAGLIIWDDVENVDHYKIYLDDESKGSNGKVNNYVLDTTEVAGEHKIRVEAVGNGKNILDADDATEDLTFIKLGCHYNFSVQDTAITWTTIEGAQNYAIIVRNGNNEIVASSQGISSNRYSLSGLSGNQTYYVQVRGLGTSSAGGIGYVHGDYAGDNGQPNFAVNLLGAPSSVSIKNGILEWAFVPHSDKYLVTIKGGGLPAYNSVYEKENEFDLKGEFDIANYVKNKNSGDYVVSVIAEGGIDVNDNGKMYVTSSSSNEVGFKKFETPEIIIENGQIKWTAVPNVESYNLMITAADNSITVLSFSNKELGCEMPEMYGAGKYKLKIQAIGNNVSTISSNVTQNKEVEKLAPPTDLSVNKGEVNWVSINNAYQYEIFTYMEISEGSWQSLGSKILMAEASNSYLPGQETGYYKIKLKTIGYGEYYLNSNIYEWTKSLYKLKAPNELSVFEGALKWSTLIDNEYGYNLKLNDAIIDVGNTSTFELDSSYVASTYNWALQSIGNNDNILSSRFSSLAQAEKSGNVMIQVWQGRLTWTNKNNTKFNLKITDLDAENPDLATFTILDYTDTTYELNDARIAGGRYAISVQSLGNSVSLLKSDYCEDLLVYKLETPENGGLVSDYEAEGSELANLGNVRWDAVTNASYYSIQLERATISNYIKVENATEYSFGEQFLNVGEYNLTLLAKNDGVVIVEDDEYKVVSSNPVTFSVYKLPDPTNIRCDKGVVFWDAPTFGEEEEPIDDLKYIVYYKQVAEDESFMNLKSSLLLVDNTTRKSLWNLGKYEIMVKAVGDNCIGSNVVPMSDEYIFDLFNEGNGTTESPFVLKTFEKGGVIRNINDQLDVLNYMSDCNFILSEDIQLNAQFMGIGAEAETLKADFKGSLDGYYNGETHKIIMYTNSDTGIAMAFNGEGTFGLFKVLNAGGVVKNLVLENFAVAGSYSKVGTVVGENYGKVMNIQSLSTNAITSQVDSGLMYVGGLVGENAISGEIVNCVSKIRMEPTNTANIVYTGGIVGFNKGLVSDCKTLAILDENNNKLVDQIKGNIVGGIVGLNEYNANDLGKVASILKSSNEANLYGVSKQGSQGSGQAYVGGIVGKNDAGTTNLTEIIACYNSGDVLSFNVTSNSNLNARSGGLVGSMKGGRLSYSYNVGRALVISSITNNVRRYDVSLAGGIFGWNEDVNSITEKVYYRYEATSGSYYRVNAIPESCTTIPTTSENYATLIAEFATEGEGSVLNALNSSRLGEIFSMVNGLPVIEA